MHIQCITVNSNFLVASLANSVTTDVSSSKISNFLYQQKVFFLGIIFVELVIGYCKRRKKKVSKKISYLKNKWKTKKKDFAFFKFSKPCPHGNPKSRSPLIKENEPINQEVLPPQRWLQNQVFHQSCGTTPPRTEKSSPHKPAVVDLVDTLPIKQAILAIFKGSSNFIHSCLIQVWISSITIDGILASSIFYHFITVLRNSWHFNDDFQLDSPECGILDGHGHLSICIKAPKPVIFPNCNQIWLVRQAMVVGQSVALLKSMIILQEFMRSVFPQPQIGTAGAHHTVHVPPSSGTETDINNSHPPPTRNHDDHAQTYRRVEVRSNDDNDAETT